MKPILQSIMTKFQNAFVPNRLIYDNILVSYECVEHIMKKKYGKVGSMPMKLDMSKAYDRVEWIFLEKVMIRMGFSPVWVSSLMNCISSVRFSVLINGHAQGFVRPQRGLHQGDPLSFYLFLICAESLSHSLSSTLSQRKIYGCQIAYQCPKISRLFFADDCLLFCKASVKECQMIQNILEKYELASAQSVNFKKSAMFFSPCVDVG